MAMTRNSRVIKATPGTLYRAFTSPEALEVWMAPGEMKGKVHRFELREGGSYEMSLYYPENDVESRGKSGLKEDRYTARFVTLQPYERIVEAIKFDSSDEGFAGDMIMEVGLEKVTGGTRVTIVFSQIPTGIRPEDNEKGTELTLDKLAKYVMG